MGLLTDPFERVFNGGKKEYHVVYNKSLQMWEIDGSGGVFNQTQLYSTKINAVRNARKLAERNRPAQVYVHDKEGKISDESTYGNDPYPPEG